MSFSVDIIIAAFNAADTIERALDSACNQDECKVNIYVVDDGSTDNTASLIRMKSLSDPRIKLITQSNKGTAAARNAAIFSGSAEWITYLDSDDELAPNWGSKMCEFMDLYPTFDVYSSNGMVIGNNGVQKLVFKRNKIGEVTLDDLIEECAVLGGGALVSRTAMQNLKGFDEQRYGEDYDFWLRLVASSFRIFYAPEALYIYHQEGDTRKSDDMEKGALSGAAALEDLIKNFQLSDDQITRAGKSISRYQEMGALKTQSDKYQSLIIKLLGSNLGGSIWERCQRFSFVVRPLRRAIVKLRSARK